MPSTFLGLSVSSPLWPPMTRTRAHTHTADRSPLAGHLESFESLLRPSQRPLCLRLDHPHSRHTPLGPHPDALDPLHSVSCRDSSQYRFERTAVGERALGEYPPRGRGRSCCQREAAVPLEGVHVARRRGAPRWRRTGRYHLCRNREEGHLPPGPGAGSFRTSTDGRGQRGGASCGDAELLAKSSRARTRTAGVRSVDQGSGETERATVRCRVCPAGFPSGSSRGSLSEPLFGDSGVAAFDSDKPESYNHTAHSYIDTPGSRSSSSSQPFSPSKPPLLSQSISTLSRPLPPRRKTLSRWVVADEEEDKKRTSSRQQCRLDPDPALAPPPRRRRTSRNRSLRPRRPTMNTSRTTLSSHAKTGKRRRSQRESDGAGKNRCAWAEAASA